MEPLRCIKIYFAHAQARRRSVQPRLRVLCSLRCISTTRHAAYIAQALLADGVVQSTAAELLLVHLRAMAAGPGPAKGSPCGAATAVVARISSRPWQWFACTDLPVRALLRRRQPRGVRIDTHLEHCERQWCYLVEVHVPEAVKRADVLLNTCPEAPDGLQDRQGVREQLDIRLEVRVDHVLDEFVAEVVAVGIDVIQPVGLSQGDGIAIDPRNLLLGAKAKTFSAYACSS